MPAKLGTRNDLGVALSFLRWVRGWDQETLAAASGVKLQSIKAIEQGKGARGASPQTLGPILDSLGFSLETLVEVRSLIRRLRAKPMSARPYDEASGTSPCAYDLAAPGLRRDLFPLLAPPLEPAQRVAGPSELEASRLEAPSLWARFRACPDPGQFDLARVAAEFQTSGFVELLCEKSRNAACDSAARALHLARCAVVAAATLPGSEGWCSRIKGYAGVHVASALRVGGDLTAADRTFSPARELWQAGAAEDPGLLNAARVLHLDASLRRDQRRLREALALLDEALVIDGWGETPTLLMSKAKVLEELGQYDSAIALLIRAASQLDREREPRNLFVVQSLLALNLCHLGRHAEAERSLAEPRALATKLGNRLDLLRVDWLQGKVAAGLGRTDDAIGALGRVRAAFMAQDNAYDTALVTLELAEIHAALGNTAEVKALAQESAPVFQAQGVHREAQKALDLFRRAAEEEKITAELVRGVVTFLYRSRHDSRVRYQRPA
jgi:tetratricopeptide (TPR) repeat protein/transcriptional regulator with XRE-family HTH domain